ncbi:LruC domain-containing protein [Seonamhaeicola sp. ML3]|uniref:LruC domain-containing protein n=1 Tax=Seonamhaeicola sp. ML3 TaxID=2937786 RepID=UPI00200E1ED6|nr:LruC domain-containing protein [Seonamhaeicola sp. ML3]
MKLIVPKLIAVCLVFVLLSSCDVTQEIEDFRTEESQDTETPVSEDPIDNLNIPTGFSFNTQQEVRVVINDVQDNVKYDIYAYSDEKQFVRVETFENEEGETVTDSVFKNGILDKLIFNGVTKGGRIDKTITIPSHFSKLYLRRKDYLRYSSDIVDINNGQVNFFSSGSTGKSALKNNAADLFYSVNGNGELFQIDVSTGASALLSYMPAGSNSCAIDQEEKVLYAVGRSWPYILMKYSIENNSWENIANLGVRGYRMDFNSDDELLYMSDRNQVHLIDPNSGVVTETRTINGIFIPWFGDIAFDSEGVLYMSSISGVHRLDLNQNNEYDSTELSNETIPFWLTGMAFDSSGKLWLAEDKFFSSNIMTMNLQTGDWQYEYGSSANNSSSLNYSIDDLAILKPVADNQAPDTDGDGVTDTDDAYPDDPEKAFDVFAPSENGWGTFAFEDLWPHTGDYDFNDVALRYRFKTILNSDNDVVQIDFTYNVKATGAGFTNGFGLEIESLSPAQIESVTGLDLKQAYINLNANGTESEQNNAVFVIFDDARSMLGNEVTVSINLAQPINLNSLGSVPFNPFVIVNKERDREIHLPFKSRTTLGTDIGGIKDADGNYVTETGLPWGINVAYDFKVPNERVTIIEAYNFFGIWAASGGLANVDWYRNNPGNINNDKVAQD